MSEENAIATVQNVMSMPAGAMVCSIKPDKGDRAAAAKLYNAMNNPTSTINDMIGQEIQVQDFLIEMQEFVDEETGEYSTTPRCVFIAPDGTSYSATSKGMGNVIRNLVAAFGPAPWDPAIVLKIKQVKVKKGSMLTADVVM